MSKTQTLIPRSKVKESDTWNLSPLFASNSAWEKSFKQWEKLAPGYKKFQGRLHTSAKTLAELLKFDAKCDRLGEKLGVYAYLRATQDQGDSEYQRMRGRYEHVSTKFSEAGAYIRPEILSIPKAKMDQFLKSRELAEWKLALERILRYRPYTLAPNEERLLAMQGPAFASGQIFRQLTDADLKWPAIENEKGIKIELGQSTISVFLQSPKRAVRQEAFTEFYKQFESHKNTLASALNGSNQRDCIWAKSRGYKSAREASLFSDNVPLSVYDNLIASVHKHLPKVHKYYEVRRQAMKLKDIHHYDTYVPIFSELEKHNTWDQAVTLVTDALSPLGEEYCRTLRDGLSKERWCDRYPNAGKQSGAFSYGIYDAMPYIMMNYQPSVLDHVFTLAHEAGHSMHSWYSVRNQPYQYYNYPIFVAEVASTFNEQLLAKHLMDRAESRKEKAYLINMMIDDIRGTVVRQTMFAEFEKISHELVETGEPLTVDAARKEYRKLLELYFGPKFAIDPQLELECLRIPHFYSAFYVYKYATGLSAAIALSQRVLNGGAAETKQYLNFLGGGCSKWPLDLLRDAGVDMARPDAVNSAMKLFGDLVDQLEELL